MDKYCISFQRATVDCTGGPKPTYGLTKIELKKEFVTKNFTSEFTYLEIVDIRGGNEEQKGSGAYAIPVIDIKGVIQSITVINMGRNYPKPDKNGETKEVEIWLYGDGSVKKVEEGKEEGEDLLFPVKVFATPIIESMVDTVYTYMNYDICDEYDEDGKCKELHSQKIGETPVCGVTEKMYIDFGFNHEKDDLPTCLNTEMSLNIIPSYQVIALTGCNTYPVIDPATCTDKNGFHCREDEDCLLGFEDDKADMPSAIFKPRCREFVIENGGYKWGKVIPCAPTFHVYTMVNGGDPDPSQQVVFNLINYTSLDTFVDTEGKVTIAEDELSGNIQVIATSVFRPDLSSLSNIYLLPHAVVRFDPEEDDFYTRAGDLKLLTWVWGAKFKSVGKFGKKTPDPGDDNTSYFTNCNKCKSYTNDNTPDHLVFPPDEFSPSKEPGTLPLLRYVVSYTEYFYPDKCPKDKNKTRYAIPIEPAEFFIVPNSTKGKCKEFYPGDTFQFNSQLVINRNDTLKNDSIIPSDSYLETKDITSHKNMHWVLMNPNNLAPENALDPVYASTNFYNENTQITENGLLSVSEYETASQIIGMGYYKNPGTTAYLGAAEYFSVFKISWGTNINKDCNNPSAEVFIGNPNNPLDPSKPWGNCQPKRIYCTVANGGLQIITDVTKFNYEDTTTSIDGTNLDCENCDISIDTTTTTETKEITITKKYMKATNYPKLDMIELDCPNSQ